MVVTKDPETGELRPATAAEREKLLGRKALAAPEHTVVTLPDGSVMVELGEADMSYAVATRGADGKIVQSCVHGKEAAKAATTEKVAPAAATPAPAAPATDR
jgi:topoisomerase IA-like protein